MNQTRALGWSRDRALLPLTMSTELIVESPADFHVHLRQGELSEIVTPHVRKGGFDLAYVMVRDLA